MVKGQKSTGRKKVEIKRIDDEEARQVCFSKRRQGLFNKANELSILCGAIVGVVVFSISGRAYSIGHPSIEAVINRFLAPNPPNVLATSGGGANQDGGGLSDTVRLLCEQYAELQGLVEEELKRKESLQEAIDKEMGSRVMQWLSAKVYDLGQDELQAFYKELQAMRGVVLGKENQMMAEAMQIPSPQPQPPMDVATASQQYLFGEPSSQLQQPPMDIASSSQCQHGEHSALPMPVNGPSSTNGFNDGFEVDDLLLSDINGLGGSGNFPNDKNLS